MKMSWLCERHDWRPGTENLEKRKIEENEDVPNATHQTKYTQISIYTPNVQNN